jgi:hypothetical protein
VSISRHRRTLLRAVNPEWEVVASSNVHSALYDPGTGELFVRFLRSGVDDIYVYPSRERQEWEDFRMAASKGSWIWQNPIAEDWSFDLITMRAFSDVEPDDVDGPTRDFLFKQL